MMTSWPRDAASTSSTLSDARHRAARAEGLPLTVETCPHYLCLTAEEIPDGQTQSMRGASNQQGLWRGLEDGHIDFIIRTTTLHAKPRGLHGRMGWDRACSLGSGPRQRGARPRSCFGAAPACQTARARCGSGSSLAARAAAKPMTCTTNTRSPRPSDHDGDDFAASPTGETLLRDVP